MDEYIDREALIQELDAKLCALHGELDENRIVYDAFTDGFEECVGEVRNFQFAADVAPVVHGHWEAMHYEGGVLDGTNFDKCSVCGYERIIDDEKLKTAFNFCPNCGAKMDGGATNAVD